MTLGIKIPAVVQAIGEEISIGSMLSRGVDYLSQQSGLKSGTMGNLGAHAVQVLQLPAHIIDTPIDCLTRVAITLKMVVEMVFDELKEKKLLGAAMMIVGGVIYTLLVVPVVRLVDGVVGVILFPRDIHLGSESLAKRNNIPNFFDRTTTLRMWRPDSLIQFWNDSMAAAKTAANIYSNRAL